MTTEDQAAEQIADVVKDLREGRLRALAGLGVTAEKAVERALRPQTVVNATPIYRSLVAKDEPAYLYEDHPCIAPPWDDAMIAYVNEHNNVIVMQVSAEPWPEGLRWKTPNGVAWGELRWLLDVFVWIGGRDGTGRYMQTTGPCHQWRFAVMPDGSPADLSWVHLIPEYPMERWDMAHLTVLGALNFLACKNVAVEEPHRPRAARRRLAKTGIAVNDIVVRPIGRRTRSARSGKSSGSVPLTSVRGHFARYGPEYNRGLLFGKYAGRFWFAAHARGQTGDGGAPAERTYRLAP